jgi:TolB-like protein/DNA-binding winged helix-turn-helix (wHTH) protein
MAGGNAETRAAPVELAATGDFELGGLRVCPARRLVQFGEEVRELEPRVMQVLVALAAARPHVVSRDRLVDRCWDGRIVGDDSINRCIAALRRLAKEMSPEPFVIETVPRVGYWLAEQDLGRPAAVVGPSRRSLTAAIRRAGRPVWAALIAGLVLVAVAAVTYWPRSPAEPAPVSLAVLPFRNLTTGDDYFAEGVAEEILTQLSREPELRVAGRTSSWIFKGGGVDPREVGRRLGVPYILEGSVRTAGNRVRIAVALVRARDGIRLWSEVYEGSLDDIFAIQDHIGAAVAANLKRKLIYAGQPSGSLRTSGEVYSLYLAARGLIRERSPAAMAAAKEKLRRAIDIDPNFAPAWSSLAQTESLGGIGRDRERGRAYARKALALAPDFPQVHGVLGMLLGYRDPVGQAHIERAVALDPNNAEFQFWAGNVYGEEADFPRMLEAYRRAFEIDPLWERAQEAAILAAWSMGYRAEAVGYVRRVERAGSRFQVHCARASLAEARGDFSAQVRESAAAGAATSDVGQKMDDANYRGLIYRNLGLVAPARRLLAGFPFFEQFAEPPYLDIRQGKPPPLEELRRRNLNLRDVFEDVNYVRIGAKLLINAGRAADVVALYDSDDGILQIFRGRPPGPPAAHFQDGPIVAAALRAVGREIEAERILAQIDRDIVEALRRSGGRAPSLFWAQAAQTWAMRGKTEAALAALERARENGWVYVHWWDDDALRDIGDEPAFRALRGQPRFERLRAELNGHLARERGELERLARQEQEERRRPAAPPQVPAQGTSAGA